MEILNKVWTYFEALATIMCTICFIVGTDYTKLNNTENILIIGKINILMMFSILTNLIHSLKVYL